MPKYAVIIPTYNSARTLDALLASLAQQTFTDFEVMVVDDASTDETPEVVAKHAVGYERLPANGGPALARNLGAGRTSAPWLVYTDADTEFTPDTLRQIDAVLDRCDADALVGSYAGKPANAGFAPRYKALWEYCMIDARLALNEKQLCPIGTWAPRPGVVRRSVFDAVGGFRTTFRGADLEDMEFGYRMAEQGYRIYLAPEIRIRHHYPATMRRELTAFARRVAIWVRMSLGRRTLDSHGEGSPQQALGHLAGFGAFLLLIAGLAWLPLAMAGLGGLLVFLVLNGNFLRAAWLEGGVGFAVAAGVYCWLHSIVMGFAAAYGLATAAKGMETHGG